MHFGEWIIGVLNLLGIAADYHRAVLWLLCGVVGLGFVAILLNSVDAMR